MNPGLLTDVFYMNENEVCKEENSWVRQRANNSLLISPYDEKCVTPVGYDLRIGDQYIRINKSIHTKKPLATEELKKEGKLLIQPNELIAIRTLEKIGMPRNKTLSGILVSKVSLANLGISHVSASIDPDWKGHLLVTLCNLNPLPIEVQYGQPFCTLLLFVNSEPARMDSNDGDSKHPHKLTDMINRGITAGKIIYKNK